MGLRRAIIEQVFKVKQVEGIFSDAINNYAASATAATTTPQRVGQVMIGSSGGTWLAWKAKATGATGTAAWESLPIT